MSDFDALRAEGIEIEPFGAAPPQGERVKNVCKRLRDGNGKCTLEVTPLAAALINDLWKVQRTDKDAFELDKSVRPLTDQTDALGYALWAIKLHYEH
jgi:hypothetical protein